MPQNTMIALLAIITLVGTHAQAGEKITFNSTAMARAEEKTESELLKQLKTTKVSAFKVKGMQIDSAFAFLSQRYKSLSGTGNGLNVLFKNTRKEIKKKLVTVDLSATDVPVTDVLYYLCMSAGLNYRIDEHAVVVWERNPKEQLNRY